MVLQVIILHKLIRQHLTAELQGITLVDCIIIRELYILIPETYPIITMIMAEEFILQIALESSL